MAKEAGGNAGAAVRDGDLHLIPHALGRNLDARGSAGIAHGIAHDVGQHLIEQDLIRPHQRQVLAETHRQVLDGPAPAGRSDRLVHHLAHIHPVAAQIERARLKPRHGEEVADHAVEMVRLLADLREQVAPLLGIDAGAVFDEAR